MPLDEEFCDSPYQFMKRHIVRVVLSPNYTRPASNEVEAFVIKSPYGQTADNGGEVCLLHIVEDPGAPPPPRHTRKVYWCHYEKDNIHGTTLSRKHVYMFTPQMDGCSFGAGALSNDGSVTVAHSNAATFGAQHAGDGAATGALQAQAQQQINLIDQNFGAQNKNLGRLISPFVYMRGQNGIDFGLKATTFGRRNDRNEWKFYSHVYRIQNPQCLHMGVQNYSRNVV